MTRAPDKEPDLKFTEDTECPLDDDMENRMDFRTMYCSDSARIRPPHVVHDKNIQVHYSSETRIAGKWRSGEVGKRHGGPEKLLGKYIVRHKKAPAL